MLIIENVLGPDPFTPDTNLMQITYIYFYPLSKAVLPARACFAGQSNLHTLHFNKITETDGEAPI
jgi:hypothetical protein